MPALSIIVPVYKTEKYLPKCIDSILAQTFVDFELILIDDGSPDHCGEICDEYALKDGRIIVIHQENKGVSAARNAGLDIARGEYIGFVDSDDWIEPEMYEILVTTMVAKSTDVVICGCTQRNGNGDFLLLDFQSEGTYTQEQLLKAMYSKPNPIGGILWNKLFRKSTIGELRFNENMRNCEDGMFVVEYLFSACSGFKITDPLYNVVQRVGSASRSGDAQQVYHTVCGFADLRECLKKRPYNKELDALSAELVLDSGARFGTLVLEIQKRNKQSCKKEIAGICRIMRKTIWESIAKGLLPIRSIHGYIHEMHKLGAKKC